MQEQITAALKKLGPVSPGALADHLGVEPSALSYHLKAMLDAGTLKAAGKTSGRRVALPEQKLDEATDKPTPPQRGKKHRRAKHAKRAPHAPARRAKRAAAPKSGHFIPTIDAESRLVIVNGGEPHVYSEEQTTAIASLLFQHYDKG